MKSHNLYHWQPAQWAAYLALFAAMAAVPTFIDNPFTLNQLSRYAIYALLAVSVSFVWGFAGILSLGQGIAFGLAAYGMAMTMQMQSQDAQYDPVPSFMLTNGLDTLPWLWEPFWNTELGIVLALAVPTVFFAGFGLMMFQARVAGVFVAIMTLAMLSAFYSMATDMQPYTAGFNGISPPQPFRWGETTVDPYSADAYLICVSVLAGLTLLLKALLASKFGLLMQAIRDDAERARFLGYNVALYQLVVFAISGFVAAAAGVCWVMMVQYVSPTALEITFSISMVIWAAVGGRTSLFGAIIGALLVNGTASYLGDELQQIWMLLLGGVFILIVLLLPRGLAELFERIIGRATRAVSGSRRAAGAPAEEVG